MESKLEVVLTWPPNSNIKYLGNIIIDILAVMACDTDKRQNNYSDETLGTQTFILQEGLGVWRRTN